MAVTVQEYNQFKDMVLNGLDFDTTSLKVALFESAFTETLTNTAFGTLTNECSGAGYTAGGGVVPGRAISGGEVAATAVQWGSLTINVRYVVLYADATIDGVISPLLLTYDLGEELNLSAVPWSFSWVGDVLFSLT